jgi:hypothetical protein
MGTCILGNSKLLRPHTLYECVLIRAVLMRDYCTRRCLILRKSFYKSGSRMNMGTWQHMYTQERKLFESFEYHYSNCAHVYRMMHI